MGMNNQIDDQFSPCEDYALKARKPYTITKQREKWTHEEHKKFLEALKLHGRGWRQIEEHVGNKTAIQIRSHAQKFFSKVNRESSVIDGTKVDPVEIPPPRAKRKPAHPYPRNVYVPSKKVAIPVISTPPCSSESNHINPSPDSPEYVSTQSLKLFGITVFVMDSARSSSPDTITTVLPLDRMLIHRQECPITPGLSSDGIFGGKEDKYAKGFVPYKRCLAEKITHSIHVNN